MDTARINHYALNLITYREVNVYLDSGRMVRIKRQGERGGIPRFISDGKAEGASHEEMRVIRLICIAAHNAMDAM